jgi:enoyl-CoA hydratase/carnithine racemase
VQFLGLKGWKTGETVMNFVLSSKEDDIATVTLQRGKVNALNEPMIGELADTFGNLETDTEVKSIIFTGSGKFFSFGFDVPEFLSYPKKDFIRFMDKFTISIPIFFSFQNQLLLP